MMNNTINLYFTKRFESGLLKGISVPCSISFPSSETARYAKAFRKGSKGQDCITRDRFVITDASFQNYAR